MLHDHYPESVFHVIDTILVFISKTAWYHAADVSTFLTIMAEKRGAYLNAGAFWPFTEQVNRKQSALIKNVFNILTLILKS